MPPLDKRIEEWKERLIDLTRRNRSLYFRPTKSSTLQISAPDAATVFRRLYVDEDAWSFWLPPKSQADEQAEAKEWPEIVNETLFEIDEPEIIEPADDELFCEVTGRKQFERILKTIFRRAHTDYQERGIRILHMAFGTLNWQEKDGAEFVTTPLVLCPVKMVRETAGDPYELYRVEDDPVVNPALITKLQRDFNLELPPAPETWENDSLEDYFSRVKEKVHGLGWEVKPTLHLGFFSFHKLAMYRDLLDNAERIKTHSIVKGLAGERLQESNAGDIPDLRQLDQVQKPEETYQILDADSSQQQCIQAALANRNIVLQGPPGTGKSQTIANIIAEFIARGRSVLFVSEKIAALEVVFKRLRDVKLDEYCLELHSHKANKREVATTLGKSLHERQNPTRLPSQDDFAKFESSRKRLNEYVQAIHEVRQPLGKSVFEVSSLLTKYQAAPLATCEISDINTVTPSRLIEWEETVHELAAVWHVVIAGEDFVWFGCRDEGFNARTRLTWPRLLQDGVKAINELATTSQGYASSLGLPDINDLADCEWLAKVGQILNASPGPDASWLTSTELASVFMEAQKYRNLCARYWSERNELAGKYAAELFALPSRSGTDLHHLWQQLIGNTENRHSLLLDAQDDGRQLINARHLLLVFLRKTSELIQDLWRDLEKLTQILELKEDGISPKRARELALLASLSNEEEKPDADWLKPFRLPQVCETFTRLKPQYSEYNQRKSKVAARREEFCERYDESFFELNLGDLMQNFNSAIYRSPLRYLWPGYYRDKRAILNASRTPDLASTTLEDLIEAREILRLENKLKADAPGPCADFGGYDRGADTDFTKIEKAIAAAATIQSIVPTHTGVPNGIFKYLSFGSLPNAELRDIGEWILLRLDEWEELQKSVENLVPLQRLPQTQLPFSNSPFACIEQWVQELLPGLTEFAKRLDTLLPLCIANPQSDLVTLTLDLESKDEIEKLKDSIDAESEKLRRTFGSRFLGINTKWGDVLTAIEWTSEVRRLFNGRQMTSRFLELATHAGHETPLVSELLDKLETAQSCLREIEANFYTQEIKLDGLSLKQHNFPRIAEHLTDKLNKIDELQAWIDYKQVIKKTTGSWLENFISEAKRLNLTETQLLSSLKKSTYDAWVSYWQESDIRLQQFRSRTHEEAIRNFRALDAKLINLASLRIIEQCESRRPQHLQLQAQDSEVAVLRREAVKQKRHLPIRSLFKTIPNLLLKLKPCLLMSPLSVSQFLQSERLRFDLVIFDEASQIFTEDAIGAISRGSQIIVAGDSKQLPPTDFFRSLGSDDDDYNDDESSEDSGELNISSVDYESVLDECQTVDGITQQSLRWHYRSRHESLIAFSNHYFYDNRLVTFPNARDEDPNLGVKLLYVEDGIYDRGGKRHNLREAQRVADLVFDHFTKYPEKSLGVVAFSQAQMMCIEDEIERRRRTQRQFEDFFKDDRLDGFFVKNLENVQGDERDVIIFSVGYGRDANGRMTMGFGPLNRTGGQRRLNVAITRAREKVVLVSSIKAADINVAGTTAAGVLHLYRYLDYAERGVKALSLTHPQGVGEAESPLESDIASEIRQLGYDVVEQVGCSGYRIDIGVIDPAQPGHFLLGVEADGATYHSAYTARERDRLRQSVLENLGWRIHRVWSFDWFQNRTQEIEKLRQAIEKAREDKQQKVSDTAIHVELRPDTEIERFEVSSAVSLPNTEPYRIFTPILSSPNLAYFEFHALECRAEQVSLLEQVVREEGPIHIEIASRRLAEAWRLSRVGERMRRIIDRCVYDLHREEKIQRKGEFLYPIVLARAIKVRVPTSEEPKSARDVKHIPPEELQQAILLIAEYSFSLGLDSLINETRKLFGFSRTGPTIQERLLCEIRDLITNGSLEMSEDKISLAKV